MTRVPLILVVDDHPDLREVLSLVLQHHGFRVMLAGDGREAVARVEECRPDLVLMDLMMPRMDGYEATTALNADALNGNGDRTVPVVAITASRVDREELLNRGFSGVLHKPVSAQDVVQTIRSLIA